MSGHRRASSIVKQLFAALAILCATVGSAFGLDEGPWVVTALEGQAHVTLPTKAPQALQLGATIAPGSEIATAADGRVTLTRGKTSMSLSPDSRTQIPFATDQGQRTTIFQRFGSLLLQVDKRPEQHFEVQTPFLAAVVKGTTFSVDVGGTGASVFVSEGAVQVGALASGQVKLVRPGQTATVSQGPDARLEVTGGGSQQSREDRRDQGESAQSGMAPKAEQESRLASQPAEPVAPVKSLKITRTMGLGNLDIATLTDGLVVLERPTARISSTAVEQNAGVGVNAMTKRPADDEAAMTRDTSITAEGLARSTSVGPLSRPNGVGISAARQGLDAAVAGRNSPVFSGAAPGAVSSTPDVGRVVSRIVNPGIRNSGGLGGALNGNGAAGDSGAGHTSD